MKKQIIHNSEAAANAELIALEAKLKHLHTGYTKNYNNVVKHPTLNKWATRYITEGKYWDIVEAHLNPTQIGNLVDISEDWKADAV
jgi:hypothetical protein